jgi:hypothetical protein
LVDSEGVIKIQTSDKGIPHSTHMYIGNSASRVPRAMRRRRLINAPSARAKRRARALSGPRKFGPYNEMQLVDQKTKDLSAADLMKKARSDTNELDLTPNTRNKVMTKSGKDAMRRVRQKLLMQDQDKVVPKQLRNTYAGVLHFCESNTRDARRKDLGAAFDENSAYVVDG